MQIGYYDIAMVINEMLIDLRKVKNMVDKLILNKEPVYRFKMVRKPSNKRLLRIAVLDGTNKYHGQLLVPVAILVSLTTLPPNDFSLLIPSLPYLRRVSTTPSPPMRLISS